MKEDVLQYIWQTQSFNKTNLLTTDGLALSIFDPGKLNAGSGPDFSEAKIKIGEMTWVGDVEIHTYAGHWHNHRHNQDKAYDKVILHVVWQEDSAISRTDGSRIPTLELKHSLDKDWYNRYQHLMNSIKAVPCEHYLPSVDRLVVADAIQSSLVERLEKKSEEVFQLLRNHKGDWERTALSWLFSGFGFRKNKTAFQQLATHVDLGVIRKLANERQIAAYLFGLSGLLPSKSDDLYISSLIEEFNWLRLKFLLKNTGMSITWWKFMRTRPANFPTLRIAQLASVMANQKSILRTILESEINVLTNLFKVEHNEFWQRHYHFNSLSTQKLSGMGRQSQDNLLVNVVAVLLVAYGTWLNKVEYIRKAINLLESLAPESNTITRLWQTFDIFSQNAAESQGLIGLFNDYCKKSRCLSCSVGKYIIKSQ